jgi:hypothetical protein
MGQAQISAPPHYSDAGGVTRGVGVIACGSRENTEREPDGKRTDQGAPPASHASSDQPVGSKTFPRQASSGPAKESSVAL